VCEFDETITLILTRLYLAIDSLQNGIQLTESGVRILIIFPGREVDVFQDMGLFWWFSPLDPESKSHQVLMQRSIQWETGVLWSQMQLVVTLSTMVYEICVIEVLMHLLSVRLTCLKNSRTVSQLMTSHSKFAANHTFASSMSFLSLHDEMCHFLKKALT
jgi:hypothetical protein